MSDSSTCADKVDDVGCPPTILYDFAKGHPNNAELPVAELQDLFGQLQSDSEALRRALQYGQACGNADLIRELGAFVERQCGADAGIAGSVHDNSAAKNSFFITEGVSHGIDLLTAAATQPGDLVLTERPTYYLIAGIFRSHGLTVDALPMRKDSSIDLDRLERELEAGLRPRLIYTIPAHQNPTGRCMGTADRRRLGQLAVRYAILIVADEVYHLLDWGGEPRSARMVTWNPPPPPDADRRPSDKLSGCVTVSSFTKIFGPGVRCGWIEAERAVVEAVNAIGYLQSQGAVGPVIGCVLQTGLATGTVDDVLSRLRGQYQYRCNFLCDVLQAEPAIQLVCRPTGGYFVWIRFPFPAAPDFLYFCLKRGVSFMPGPRCDACPDDALAESLQPYARLCFAKLSDLNLEQGAARLLDCVRSFLASTTSVR